ncbi:MAG: M15 family metallopeptidase [Pseudoalteromonas sp.]|uniref:M15 family metallopeptidase n=1 Tax=unclassified Pseudoalteromonas TaxID=194690 RepID=UPI003F967937
MNVTPLTLKQLVACACGKSERLLAPYQGHKLHKDIISDFNLLQNAAREAGFHIAIASSFRDFNRQSLIWNNKFNAKRAVLDKQNKAVDLAALSDIEKCHAIMLYSALPGASRHHFGTDLDIFDAGAVPDDYKLKLEADEYQKSGPFAPLTKWLDDNLTQFGFYRPYQHDLGGVAPEPWHISHITESEKLAKLLTIEALKCAISDSELCGKESILEHLPALYQRYVVNLSPA